MSAIIQNIRERIRRKVNKVCKGSGKVEHKTMCDLMLGISSSRDVKLSNIGRSLHEETEIKYTIKRLSRNVIKYDYVDRINGVMTKEVLNDSQGTEIVIIDISDIRKNYGKKMEAISTVYDGSEKELCQGYEMLVSGVITKSRIIPTYIEAYSSKGKDYDTRWYKSKKLLDMLVAEKNRGKSIGTIVMDRGFDSQTYYKYMINKGLGFIVRLKLNRNIELLKKTMKVGESYEFMRKKEYLSEVIHNGKKKKTKIRIGYATIKLGSLDEPLTIVMIKSKLYAEPMYLITNKRCNSRESAKIIYEKYLQRWGIETLIRTLKEEYNIEDVRILKYKGIKNIISLAFFCLFLLSKIVYSIGHNTHFIKIYLLSKGRKIRKIGAFLYHAVSYAISVELLADKKKICFYPKIILKQPELFNLKFFG